MSCFAAFVAGTGAPLEVVTLAVPALMTLLAVAMTVWLSAWREKHTWRRDLRLDAYIAVVRTAHAAAHHAGAVMVELRRDAVPETIAAQRDRLRFAVFELDGAALVAQWTVSTKGSAAVREMTHYCVTVVIPFVQTAGSATAGWHEIETGLRARVHAIETAAREELGLFGGEVDR